MASPKVHIFPTSFLLIVWALFYFPMTLTSKDLVVAMAVIFWGVLVDVDHLSSIRPRRIRDGSWLEQPGHLDWLHTFGGLAAAIATSLVLHNPLPFSSYAIHMLIDGGNRNVLKSPKKGPLLTRIHKFYPEWAKYSFSLR